MKFFRDILTGVDGVTYDNIRVFMLIGILTIIGAAITGMVQGKAFDYLAFGGGFAAVLAAGGAGIGLKSKTEPANK